MEILVTRHGQTDWNAKNLVQGKIDIELNINGIDQAKETAKKLLNEKIDLIISSPLKRAVQTAEIINEGRGIPIIFDEGFSERAFGEYEGVSRDKFDFGTLWNVKTDIKIKNGESVLEFIERIKKALERIKKIYNGKSVLIVCHGGVSMAMQGIFNGLREDGGMPFGIQNCEVISFSY